MNVGELRKLIANIPDDVTVVVEGGEWEFQEAHVASVMVVEWHDEEEDDEDGNAQSDRLCLVVK